MPTASPVVIVFDFTSKTVTQIGGDSAGAQRIAEIAGQQHEMQTAFGKPA